MDKIIPSAVVALVVSLLAFAGFSALSSPNTNVPSLPGAQVIEDYLGALQGVVLESPYVFKNGVGTGGDFLTITQNGKIGQGANQGAWRNTLNRNVFVEHGEIGFMTGTATSSYEFYAATSSSATLSENYARPAVGLNLLIDGASVATSTPGPRHVTSTTTASGDRDGILVKPGEYLVFQVQEKFACKTDGACNTATSTNRGITEFFWYFRGHLQP